MKLSMSNIAWGPEQDRAAYALLQKYGFTGLEIAPTRILPEQPYVRLEEAAAWAQSIRAEYGLEVPSIQSIWYGRKEKLFGPPQERQALLEYTGAALRFAQAIGCKNLVFGCPVNRNRPEGADLEPALELFRALGDIAQTKSISIGLEPNPPIYRTNFMNDIPSVLEIIQQAGSPGLRLNLDMGALIENGESLDLLTGRVSDISHVHISEPGLPPLKERRELHQALRRLLEDEGYRGYVSIEMGRVEDMAEVERALSYVSEIFG